MSNASFIINEERVIEIMSNYLTSEQMHAITQDLIAEVDEELNDEINESE